MDNIIKKINIAKPYMKAGEDTVQKIAFELNSECREIKSCFETIDKTITNMLTYWQGMSAEANQEFFQDLREELSSVSKGIDLQMCVADALSQLYGAHKKHSQKKTLPTDGFIT